MTVPAGCRLGGDEVLRSLTAEAGSLTAGADVVVAIAGTKATTGAYLRRNQWLEKRCC